MVKKRFDAVVVGSGPNGFAAGITLARKGLNVIMFEAKSQVGGGVKSAELTLPGVIHDVCSSVFPMANSPFFNSLPLKDLGIEWIKPPLSLAHPFQDGSCAVLGSIDETAQSLGRDKENYRSLMAQLTTGIEDIIKGLLAPLGNSDQLQNVAKFLDFGKYALQSAVGFMSRYFSFFRARAFFTGIANHAIVPLDGPLSSSMGLMLLIFGHKYGWQIAKGGATSISDGLRDYFVSLGGKVVTGSPVFTLEDLPAAKAVLLDISPRQLLSMAGKKLPIFYEKQLKNFRYGLGVFKIDWALDRPVPFTHPDCAKAATVHIGGKADEILMSEEEVWSGRAAKEPFVLLVQPSLFDETRTQNGIHILWGYCHVPLYSKVDMTERIEEQIEKFAPGFRSTILQRNVMFPKDIEEHNANNIGGSIMGGVQDWRQFFTRPAVWPGSPYEVPIRNVFICSSSTPPGGGVHGMCGYNAAQTVISQIFGKKNFGKKLKS